MVAGGHPVGAPPATTVVDVASAVLAAGEAAPGAVQRPGTWDRPVGAPSGSMRLNTHPPSRVSMTALHDPKDEVLVRRARTGDERAFGQLVERYMKSAYAVALSVTGRHEDAEDAAQESFLVALQRLDECRNPERFAGWLLTIVRNRSRNLVRRESLRAADPLPPAATGKGPTPDRDTERNQRQGRLRAALGTRRPVQREIVLLHDLEGWKHREIAERLDIPSGTVRSHLHFARKALRGLLDDAKETSDT